jgi:hypothetical protein
MNTFLYILPFSNNQLFKIGISSKDNLSRILKHDKTFGISLSEAKIIKSTSNRFIKQLERMLLATYETYKVQDEVKSLYGEAVDGQSEILSMDCFNDLIADIEYHTKKPRLNVQIIKGVKLPKKKVPTNNKPKVAPPKKKGLTSDEINTLRISLLAFFKNNLGNIQEVYYDKYQHFRVVFSSPVPCREDIRKCIKSEYGIPVAGMRWKLADDGQKVESLHFISFYDEATAENGRINEPGAREFIDMLYEVLNVNPVNMNIWEGKKREDARILAIETKYNKAIETDTGVKLYSPFNLKPKAFSPSEMLNDLAYYDVYGYGFHVLYYYTRNPILLFYYEFSYFKDNTHPDMTYQEYLEWIKSTCKEFKVNQKDTYVFKDGMGYDFNYYLHILKVNNIHWLIEGSN